MTLALALVLVGLLLMYAGIKGLSLRRLLVGDASTPSELPETARK